MKKFISICAGVAVAVCAFATGVVGPNAPQSGVITFDGTFGLIYTNSFAYPFTTPPAVIATGLLTNNSPFTVSAVTTSNFVLTATTGATTNTQVAWQAYAPYPRLQYGTITNAAALATNIAFPFPYVYPPTVSIEGGNTNANGSVAVIGVTTTNFTILCNTANTNFWQAIGQAYTPGTQNVTY